MSRDKHVFSFYFHGNQLPKVKREYAAFVQDQADRLAVGHERYEDERGPMKEMFYMSRLEAELKAYKRTGNKEALLNIANYAFLESVAPEHPMHHWDPNAKSNTASKFGSKDQIRP